MCKSNVNLIDGKISITHVVLENGDIQYCIDDWLDIYEVYLECEYCMSSHRASTLTNVNYLSFHTQKIINVCPD